MLKKYLKRSLKYVLVTMKVNQSGPTDFGYTKAISDPWLCNDMEEKAN